MLSMITGAIDCPDDHDIVLEFYTKYKILLYNEAWKYLSKQEDVEDVVHESLAKIIEHMDKFRTMAPPQRIQYGKVIVRNLSYVLMKRTAYFTMIPFESADINVPNDENSTPDIVVMRKMQRDQLRKVWAEIPIEDRLLLEQKYILDWPDRELASILGVQVQSVRMLLTRAKRRVMKQLEEKGIQVSEWL